MPPGHNGQKQQDQTPKALKPFVFHGLDLNYQPGDSQARAECCFCGKAGKLHICPETSKWDCKTCGLRGNAITFIRELWAASDKQTTDYSELAEMKKLLYPETPMFWGAARSIITDEWLMPAFSFDGKMNNLYRYYQNPHTGDWVLASTSTLNHHCFGTQFFVKDRPEVYICEGPWDAMALWEMLRSAKVTESGLAHTASESSSLYANCNVIAVPGTNSFPESVLPLLGEKTVYLMYDSDHKREVNGRIVMGAGLGGMMRAANALAKAEKHPTQVEYLCWGKEGFDPDLKDGYDVRDQLSQGSTAIDRIPHLESLLGRIQAIPPNWIVGRSAKSAKGSVEIEPVECKSYRSCIQQWILSMMKMTEGIERALSVMLACAASTEIPGDDQLWVKIIGPPSSGKTTLCEALSISKKYVFANSSFTGFHSGYKSDKEGSEDHSFIKFIRGKTLITKDGDTLLKNPQKEKILADGRDVYDKVARTFYNNGIGFRDQNDIYMTWILAGTESLRELDTSELGERYIDSVVCNEMDEELEDEIGWRVANKANRQMESQVNGSVETDTPERILAKQMTAGYLEYLRSEAADLLAQTDFPEHHIRSCQRFAKFIAFMRSRPSKKQEEKAQRELHFRLVSQLVRLAKMLAVVLNKKAVDEEVVRRVRMCALDTARGVTLNIAKRLHEVQLQGSAIASLAIIINQTEDKVRHLLRFLRNIGVVEPFQRVSAGGTALSGVKWRLTKQLLGLYNDIMQVKVEETVNASASEDAAEA